MADYVTFYGFSEDPFKNSPNPKFFFPAESHNEALSSLRYGIVERKGFILLLGERGIGKTTLINTLISTLDAPVKVAYIPRSNIPFKKLLRDTLKQLNLSAKLPFKGSMLHELYYYLIACLERDENVAIILDEAHRIGVSVVEEVRLLANLETSTTKLLQIILCGKPELREKLRADVIRQIGQRIAVTTHINPMTEKESLLYIDHRLKIVGSESAKVFTDDAAKLICRQAKGFPRAVNILCSNALSVGCGLAEEKISAATVRKIRKVMGLLKDKTLQELIYRMQSRLSLKIFLLFVLAAILATAVFLHKDQLHPLLNRYILQKADMHKTLEGTGQEQVVLDVTPKKPASDVVSIPVKREPSPSESPATTIRELAPVKPPVTLTKEPPAPAEKPDRTLLVKATAEAAAGDTLSSMAREYYHAVNTTMIDYILQLNPSITNPDLILIKQRIRIPEITDALLIKSSPDGTFMIHLATYLSRSSAIEEGRNLILKDKEIKIVPRKISDRETWYRVMAGPYTNWHDASNAVSDLREIGFPISFPD